MRAIHSSGARLTVFCYNPNIHPRGEYEMRKREVVRFARTMGIPVIEEEYDAGRWFERVAGLEDEPERGARCAVCFDVRLERAAHYAGGHGFDAFATSLGIARCKDIAHVNAAGERAAARHPGLAYWACNWRKGGGSARAVEICRCEGFYRQQYCGCIYSLREANRWRASTGREPVAVAGGLMEEEQ
jgi:epoxyqueuosine reductase